MPRGAKPYFTPEQDDEIVRRYLAGETLRAIAASYGVTYQPVTSALCRRGVDRRSKSDYAWQATPDNRAELVRLWRDGLSIPRIARQVGTGNDTVSRVLREEGVQPRYGGQNRRFKPDQAEVIASEYRSGASLADLTRRYGGSTRVIANTLARAGVDRRPKGTRRFWTDERIDWLRRQHESGRSQQSIAQEIGFSQTAVGRKLRDLGILQPTARAKGQENGSWKGGRIVDGSGYTRVLVSEGPDLALAGRTISGGYVLEHRLVMARALGRPLTRRESVHHINGDRADNRLENLQLRQGQHGNGVVMTCLDCGSHNVEAVPLS
jgi:hypothetical protein